MSPTNHLTLEPSGSGIGVASPMIAGSGVAASVRKRLAVPCVLLGMSLATAAARRTVRSVAPMRRSACRPSRG